MTAAAVIPALARRVFWRLVFTGTGGLRAEGQLPGTPCVLVANHASHADTAALLAALPARRRPVVAAAADYWFGKPGRALACRMAGGFPVRRGGGGGADLVAAGTLLAAGRDVIVFPEGTRSRDGSLGQFRSGAARLAASSGVPLVPVGIAGTSRLLPVHGRLHPARVTVRIGVPTRELPEARAAITALSVAPPGHRGPILDSRLRQLLARFAGSRLGLLLVAAWAVSEAVALPLIPEFTLAILAVAAPRRAWRLALAAALGSLAGGALMYTLAAHGVTPPAPLTTPRMHATAAAQIATEGASALHHQALSGIPYKVYGLAAGRNRVGLGGFLWASAQARGVRILAGGLLIGVLGAALRRWRRWYPAYLAAFLLVFTAGLTSIVRYWS
jgi:1-acyl-sn-glycerol-3-phosphate acyltransferase